TPGATQVSRRVALRAALLNQLGAALLRLRTRSELLECLARGVARRDADEVTTQQEVQDPVAEDAQLALPHGDRQAVVAAVHDPGDEARARQLAPLVDTHVEPEAGDGAQVLVEVVDRRVAADHRDEVLGETLAL